MTKDEALEIVNLYRDKIEKIQRKVKCIHTQQKYRDEIHFGYYLENIDFLLITIGLNLEALEGSIDRTLALYKDGFICQTERYIEDDTKTTMKDIRKKLRQIDEMLARAVTGHSEIDIDLGLDKE